MTEIFETEEAKRIKEKLEIHYTPKYGSRLNMAEIELRLINRQGLPARVGMLEDMREKKRRHGMKYGTENATKTADGLRQPMPG
jgi:hypothetical protein